MTAPIAHAEFQSPSSSLSEIIRSSISTMSSSAAAHQYHLSPADRLSPSLFSASTQNHAFRKTQREHPAQKSLSAVWVCFHHTPRERYNFALWWLGDRFWSVYPVCAPSVTDSYKSECHQQANNGPDGRIVFWFLTDHYYYRIYMMCSLLVCLFYYACRADCWADGFYWALLVPRHGYARFAHWFSGLSIHFLAMFCFECRVARTIFLYPLTIRERERSPMWFYFGTSNAQPVILFVSLLHADGSTAAAGLGKAGVMDFDGYVSLWKCWMAQSKYLCVLFALRPAACARVKTIKFLCNAIIVIGCVYFSNVPL